MTEQPISFKNRYRIGSHNWLVHRIHDRALQVALQQYATGLLLDVGCGEKPYQEMTAKFVTKHLGIDHPGSYHGRAQVDILATAYHTGLAQDSIDTLLCTFVLEHLEYPQKAIHEMYRILKPNGHLLLSAPLFWHLHEEPRDFYRYTTYGLTHQFHSAGFDVIEIKPLSGFVVTFSQELVYFLQRWKQGIVQFPIASLQWMIQTFAYAFNKWDRSVGFTWAYLIVARK